MKMLLQLSLGICAVLHFSQVSDAIREYKWGPCPTLDTVANFDFDKFKGKWFAVQKTRTVSSCITYTFQDDSSGNPHVIQSLRPFGIRIPTYFERFTQRGDLDVPNPQQGSKMTVAFPFSLIPYVPVNFWVLLSDYDNYAVLWSCRSLFIGHLQSTVILSRKPTIEKSTLDKIHSDLDATGINVDKLNSVNHDDCQYDNSETLKPSDLDGSDENRGSQGTLPPDSENETF